MDLFRLLPTILLLGCEFSVNLGAFSKQGPVSLSLLGTWETELEAGASYQLRVLP